MSSIIAELYLEATRSTTQTIEVDSVKIIYAHQIP